MGNERTRVHLRQIAVANQCTVDWNAMSGDGPVRVCGSCRQSVYNLSEMSEGEAQQLLARGEELCVRYYHRPDGTIVTSSCASTTRRGSPKLAVGVAGALTYSAAFVGISAAIDGGDATTTAADADGNVKVAMGGIRLDVIKVTPERRKRMLERRRARELKRQLEARGDVAAQSDAMPTLADWRPPTSAVAIESASTASSTPLALRISIAALLVVMILGAGVPAVGIALLVIGYRARTR